MVLQRIVVRVGFSKFQQKSVGWQQHVGQLQADESDGDAQDRAIHHPCPPASRPIYYCEWASPECAWASKRGKVVQKLTTCGSPTSR